MTMQTIGALITMMGVAGVALGAFHVWRRSYMEKPQKEAMKGWYKRRPLIIVSVLLLITGTFAWSWMKAPFHHGAYSASIDHAVDVRAFMWGWEFLVDGRPAEVAQKDGGQQVILPAGDIAFLVTASGDVHENVNHSFGLYDAANSLIGQTQAMPGKTNVLRLKLRPGTYQVLCMEFCGVMHHQMITTIEVRGEQL